MGLNEVLESIKGLTESEAQSVRDAAIRHIATITRPEDGAADDDWIVEAAREKYAIPSSNDIEIDDDPVVSHGNDGAFVAAWVWVKYPEDDEDEDEDD